MAVFTDPQSPVGKTIPLLPGDIERLRKNGGDRNAAARAYDLDPDFRGLTDYVFAQNKIHPMSKRQFDNLPTALLNKHYFGTYDPKPVDDLTAILSQPPTPADEWRNSIVEQQKQAMSQQNPVAKTLLPSGLTREGPNMFQRIGTDITQRGENVSDAMKEADMGTLGGRAGLFREAFTQGTGAVGDVMGEILKTSSGIIPNFILEGIGLVAQDLGVPQAAKALADQYTNWAQQHPEAAKNLEAVGSLGRAALNTYGVQGLATQVQEGGKKAMEGVKEFMHSEPALAPAMEEQAQQNTQRLVQPKRTAKELQELYNEDPNLITDKKGGRILSSKGPGATGDEIQMSKELHRIAPEASQYRNPVDAGPTVARKLAEKGKFVDDALQENSFALPRRESVSAVRKSVTEAATDFGDSPGIFDAELNRYSRFREQFPGTGYGERLTLKAYDADTASRFGSAIYDRATARAQAISAVRDASHAVLETAAQRAGFAYLQEVKDMATLYRVLKNISTHVSPAIFDSMLKTFTKTPFGRAITEAAGISAGLSVLP